MLARALEMSMETGETKGSAAQSRAPVEPNLAAMTEEEQIEYAMRMSMQDDTTGKDSSEKMDVDEQTADKGEDDYSEAMNDPAFLQVRILHLFKNVDKIAPSFSKR